MERGHIILRRGNRITVPRRVCRQMELKPGRYSSSLEVGSLVEKRRSRTDVVADILSVALNGARKTQLMYQANLSFKIREEYMEVLVGQGLIDVEPNSPVTYITTEQGREWLKNYEKIKL